LLLLVATVWLLQRRVMFPRGMVSLPPGPTPAEVVPRVQRWTRPVPAGKIEAWYWPAEQASGANPRPSVVFAHGNAELIDENGQVMRFYHELGMNVLVPEYRGYGRSAGSPSQKAIVSDFTAFYDRMLERPEVEADRIVYHGRSLGGGVTARLAVKRKPDAWILETTFTSAAKMAKQFAVPRCLVRDPFEVQAVVRSYEQPLLLLHGTEDEVVPIAHAHALHDAAPQSTLKTYPAGHNEAMLPKQRQDIEAFLREAGMVESAAEAASPRR
jgi:fermentation-respiration switch protein FrsA (DUF1100 family)